MSQLLWVVVPIAQLVGIAFAMFIMIRGEYVLTKLGTVLTAVVCAAAGLFVFEVFTEWSGHEVGDEVGWLVVTASLLVWFWFTALFWFPWLIATGARRGDRIAPEYYERHRRR